MLLKLHPNVVNHSNDENYGVAFTDRLFPLISLPAFLGRLNNSCSEKRESAAMSKKVI
jgi:hypothetical protein